jgi:hypothetical protein
MGAVGLSPPAPDYRPILEVNVQLGDFVSGRLNDHHELIEHVRAQLPEKLRESFAIQVRSDAFMLAPRLVFKDARGELFETGLDEGLTLPAAFLSWLCVATP